LGRVIVGAPSIPGQPFDLQVTWTLWQGWRTRQEAFSIEATTGSQIIDAPFAFDGRVQTMRWAVLVEVTWRGEKLTYTHQSNPLFPTIQSWQAVVYNQGEEPLTLEQVAGAKPTAEDEVAWKDYVQTTQTLNNVNQVHGVFLSREYEQALKAGTPLAAYVQTTIISPDEREAILRFRAAGQCTFYLNGEQVKETPVEQEGWLPGLLRKARATAVMRLRPGKNRLLAHTSPPQDKRPWWYLGGWLATPDGDLMTDLEFEIGGDS
jgi:hypothetical protein